MAIILKKCGSEDLADLQAIGIETFTDTFAAHNTPEDMQAYLDKAYDPEKLKEELSTEGSTFYFLYDGAELAGYMKINVEAALTEKMDADSLEVERIYIRPAFKRRGLGKYPDRQSDRNRPHSRQGTDLARGLGTQCECHRVL